MRVLPAEECECWRWLPGEEEEVEIVRKLWEKKTGEGWRVCRVRVNRGGDALTKLQGGTLNLKEG